MFIAECYSEYIHCDIALNDQHFKVIPRNLPVFRSDLFENTSSKVKLGRFEYAEQNLVFTVEILTLDLNLERRHMCHKLFKYLNFNI